MRRYLLTIIAVALGLFFARAATAAEVGVAVLGIEPIDVPEPLAQQLTDALRQRATNTAGVHMLPGKDLIEVKMVFGCDGETPTCMAQAGRTIGADKLIYGTLKKGGTKINVIVALKLLDVKTATVERFVNDTVPKRELAGNNVNASAARWFGQLLEVEAKPTLTVTSDPTGASVTVDGTPYGKTPLTLRDLTPGLHNVTVAMAGRQTASRNVDLKTGGTHDLSVTLEAESPPPLVQKEAPPPAIAPPPLVQPQPLTNRPTGHPGRAATIAGIAALGGALVTGGVLIYTYKSYTDLQSTANADLKGLTLTGPDTENFFHNPTCTPPSYVTSAANMPGALAKYKSDCSSGNNFAAASTGLWVATGVLAAGGIAAIIVGQVQASHARKERAPVGASLLRQTLRIVPVVATTGGGLSAAFEF
jgi:hypothetical protein